MLQKIEKGVKKLWESLNNEEPGEPKNTQLIIHEKLPNTPFTVTGNDERGYFLSLGRYRLTEPTKTKEQAIQKLDEEYWDIISRLVAAYLNFDKEQEAQETITGTINENK